MSLLISLHNNANTRMFGSGEILSYITLFDFDLIKMTWNIHDKTRCEVNAILHFGKYFVHHGIYKQDVCFFCSCLGM